MLAESHYQSHSALTNGPSDLPMLNTGNVVLLPALMTRWLPLKDTFIVFHAPGLNAHRFDLVSVLKTPRSFFRNLANEGPISNSMKLSLSSKLKVAPTMPACKSTIEIVGSTRCAWKFLTFALREKFE